MTKAEVHDRLWSGTFVSDATLAGLVKELRRVLDDRDRSAPIVRTAHGVGYAFAAAVDRTHASAHTIVNASVNATANADARGEAPVQGATRLWHWIDVDGRRIRLVEGENVIGRDPASRVWLDVASVSRRHARILVSDDGVFLEDLGSKNRTTVGETVLSGSAADCRGIGGGARARPRAPRPEAGQRDDASGRDGEAGGLRAGEIVQEPWR